MRIAVIGATGSIGSQVTRLLLGRGHLVTAIARNPERLESHSALNKLPADIFDFAQLQSALPGHEALVVAFAPKDKAYAGYFQLVEAAWRIKRSFKAAKDPHSDFTGARIENWYREIGNIFGKGMGGRAQFEYFDCDHSFRWSFVSPPWLLGLPEAGGSYRTSIDALPWSAARVLPEGVAA